MSYKLYSFRDQSQRDALAEAKRVTKPDGLLFVSIPLLTPLTRMLAHPLRSVYGLLHLVRGGKKYFGEFRYTKTELLKFLEKHSFEPLFVGTGDYENQDVSHHIGLYADYPFLRKKGEEIWELNYPGRAILRFLRLLSPWIFYSGIMVVARNIEQRFQE